MWEKYRGIHEPTLIELFAKFLKPIVDNKDNKNWNHVNLMTISREDAGRFLGRGPVEALNTEKYLNMGSRDFLEIRGFANSNLDLFEKFILFNLYKDNRKHEWDYFNYKE